MTVNIGSQMSVFPVIAWVPDSHLTSLIWTASNFFLCGLRVCPAHEVRNEWMRTQAVGLPAARLWEAAHPSQLDCSSPGVLGCSVLCQVGIHAKASIMVSPVEPGHTRVLKRCERVAAWYLVADWG